MKKCSVVVFDFIVFFPMQPQSETQPQQKGTCEGREPRQSERRRGGAGTNDAQEQQLQHHLVAGGGQETVTGELA